MAQVDSSGFLTAETRIPGPIRVRFWWKKWHWDKLFSKYVGFGDRGSTVVKVLCFKSEGRWFDPRWCQWIFH